MSLMRFRRMTLTRCFRLAAADKNVVNEFIELTPHLDLG
jgi:hypothetical protein